MTTRPAGRGGLDGLPLIAVTTSEMRSAALQPATPEADPPRREMALGLPYLEAIERAGGLPVAVPPLPPESIDPLLARVDGVCLSGGPDVHPDAYGAAPHPRLGPTEPPLDAFEVAIARAAHLRGLPVLAICRGAQVVNVARGGTLHQHLPDVVGEQLVHRQPEAAHLPTHWVSLAEGSRVSAIVGRTRVHVNSFHHQAVDVLGEGLTISGRAQDGTVEALEATDGSSLIGVQWHAECLVDREEQAALFAALVAAGVQRVRAAGAAANGRPAKLGAERAA